MGRALYLVSGLLVGKFVALNMESKELKSGSYKLGNGINVDYSLSVPTALKKEADYHNSSSVTWKF